MGRRKRREHAANLKSRLRDLRLAQGISQLHLSVYSGVDTRTIRKVEAGSVTTPMLSLLKLARALGCSVADIYPEVDMRFEQPRDVREMVERTRPGGLRAAADEGTPRE